MRAATLTALARQAGKQQHALLIARLADQLVVAGCRWTLCLSLAKSRK
jgi:hypothetical protein